MHNIQDGNSTRSMTSETKTIHRRAHISDSYPPRKADSARNYAIAVSLRQSNSISLARQAHPPLLSPRGARARARLHILREGRAPADIPADAFLSSSCAAGLQPGALVICSVEVHAYVYAHKESVYSRDRYGPARRGRLRDAISRARQCLCLRLLAFCRSGSDE